MRLRSLAGLTALLAFALFLAPLGCDLGGGNGDDESDDDADDDGADDDNDDSADDDDNDDDDSSDDDDDADDDSGDDDADDDSDDDDDDDWGFEDRWGMVYLSEGYSSTTYSPLTYSNYASAYFADPDQFADWNTPAESDGPCDRFFYDYPVQYDYDYLNGGTVTATGANVSPIHMNPVAYDYGYYYAPDYDYLNEDNLFDAGDVISFSTTGNGPIPAFSGQVTAPAPVQVTQPANFDTLVSVGSGAMTFSWTPGNGRWVQVFVSTYKNSRGQSISCQVDDEEGTVTIPASLMSDLYTDPDSLTLQVARLSVERDTVDDKDLDFEVMTYRQRSAF